MSPTGAPSTLWSGFWDHIQHDLERIPGIHAPERAKDLFDYIKTNLPKTVDAAYAAGEKAALSSVAGPVNDITGFIDTAGTLSHALENAAMAKVETAGEGAFTASRGALGTVGGQAGAIVKRIQAAEQAALFDVDKVAAKLQGLHAMQNIAAAGQCAESALRDIDLRPLKNLYAKVAAAGAGASYAQDLSTVLGALTEALQGLQTHVPVQLCPPGAVDKLKTAVAILPADALDLLAGLLPLDDLRGATKVLEGLGDELENATISKDTAKTLIATAAGLRTIGLLLKEAGHVLPAAIGVGEQTDVDLDEKAGVGLAAAVRGGGEADVAEGAGASGGITIVKVGEFVCGLGELVVEGVATTLDVVRDLFPVNKEG